MAKLESELTCSACGARYSNFGANPACPRCGASQQASKEANCSHEKLGSLSYGSHKFICKLCGKKLAPREGDISKDDCSHLVRESLEGGSHKFYCTNCGKKIGSKKKDEERSQIGDKPKKNEVLLELFCPTCGERSRDNAAFCHSCGRRLEKELTHRPSELNGPDCQHPDLKTLDSGRLFCSSCGEYISRVTGFPEPRQHQGESGSVNSGLKIGAWVVGILVVGIIGVVVVMAAKHSSSSSISSGGYISTTDAQVLSESGSTAVNVDALSLLAAGANIRPNFSSGDGSLKSYADALYAAFMGVAATNYGSTPATGPITESDMETQLQPGFGLNTTITNLFPASDAQAAVLDEFRQDAANDEAAGKTYEDYRNG